MSEKDERVANALRVLTGEPVQPIRQRWWHGYGRVLAGLGDCYQLTVICESLTPPEDAKEMAADMWGPWLASWDHEPSNREQEAVTPEEFQQSEEELAMWDAMEPPTSDAGDEPWG